MTKILIAEDDPANREIVLSCLMNTSSDYTMFTAVNGEMAVIIAEKKIPDLIIMDWEMPVMNGIEAIKILKKNWITKEIPVIMFTGVMISSENLKTALEAGAIDFIRKPVDPVELIARVNSMLLLTKYYREKVVAEKNLRQMEVTAIMLQMISKNEALGDLKIILEKLQSTLPAEGTPLAKAILLVNENLESDKYWENFNNQFNLLHPGFVEQLVNELPDLSKTEQKLCSFIKMNLSTKEIAQILNVTTEAVEKSRYRLRKKLNLGDENLSGFIRSL